MNCFSKKPQLFTSGALVKTIVIKKHPSFVSPFGLLTPMTFAGWRLCNITNNSRIQNNGVGKLTKIAALFYNQSIDYIYDT